MPSNAALSRIVAISGRVSVALVIWGGGGLFAADSRPVGVLDHRLVSQENWIKPWKADWEGPRIVALLESRGLKAGIVGLDALRSAEKLKAYRAILTSGPDVAAIRSARLLKSRVYDLTPMAARVEAAGKDGAGRIAQQVTLTGQADWELAEAAADVSPQPGDLSRLAWTKVRLPGTVQLVLFQAGKTPNPWYADNYKQLQGIHKKDWYLRRKFRVPEEWRGRLVRLLGAKPLGADEAELTVAVRNQGSRPAYPVRVAVQPDAYPARWTDNHFWLAEGEEVTVTGVVRLNLRGLDPVTNPPPVSLHDLGVAVSAWNAPGVLTREVAASDNR